MIEKQYPVFAACSRGLAELLAAELEALGCMELRCAGAGVHFSGSLRQIYEVMLHARVASAVLLPLAKGEVRDAQQLYDLVQSVDWSEHFGVAARIKVEFIGTNTAIRHTGFGAQRVKDAVVDQFQARFGERPTVDLKSPDIFLQVHLAKHGATVSLNLAGPSLHRRGYRCAPVKAPLKETLAAAVLLRAGWPKQFGQESYLLDPMCGSGTLLIEAVFLHLGIAPGLVRARGGQMAQQSLSDAFGFHAWLGHEPEIWASVVRAACVHRDQALAQARASQVRRYVGCDLDASAVRAARANIAAAGLEDLIFVSATGLEALPAATALFPSVSIRAEETHGPLAGDTQPVGLVIVNPPYGERLGDQAALNPLYQMLGARLKAGYAGWQLGVFTGNTQLAGAMRLRAQKKYRLMNGPIASQLWLCDLIGAEQAVLRREVTGVVLPEALSEGSIMVLNRLKKNHKRLKRWREQSGITCYRLYDADLPEFACAVDLYGEAVHVQEYAAPKEIPLNLAASRLNQLLAAVSCFFQCPVESIACKVRQRQSGDQQYQRLSDSAEAQADSMVVKEGEAQLEVNLRRYLDTGLFLDHRPLRRKIFETASQKSFLNLFCYTASATVHAALGGASTSVSVDLSKTYLNWAQRNFRLNGLNTQNHQLINADCLQWLKQCREKFDMIMLDPPTFSNSKKMDTVLDVQRDHVGLISDALRCLRPKGILYFSTNLRSFKMDTAKLSALCHLEDISADTLDMDFSRNQRIHQCWRIMAREPS